MRHHGRQETGDFGVPASPESQSKNALQSKSLSRSPGCIGMVKQWEILQRMHNPTADANKMSSVFCPGLQDVQPGTHKFPRQVAQSRGRRTLSIKGQRVIVQALYCLLARVTTVRLCCHKGKTAGDNLCMNEYGRIPTMLDLCT